MKKVLLTVIFVTLIAMSLLGYEYTVSGKAQHLNYASFVCMVPAEISVVFTGLNGVIQKEIVYSDTDDQYFVSIEEDIVFTEVTATFAHKEISVTIQPNGHVVIDLISIHKNPLDIVPGLPTDSSHN